MKLFFLFIAIFSMIFSGCKSSIKNLVKDNISEIRQFVLYGKDDVMSANIMCGYREMEYKINGYPTELVEFGVLTINFVDKSYMRNDIEFVLFVGTKKYEGEFEINPFDNSLVTDIKKIINKNENVSVIVKVDDIEFSIKLKNIDSNWVLNSEDCINILVDLYNVELKKLCKDGVFQGEVYIKIMNDEKNLVADFYYLISVYGRSGQSINIIISPLTADILASNVNF